jgi:hypothetical protein
MSVPAVGATILPASAPLKATYVATLEVNFNPVLNSRGRAAGTEQFPAGKRLYVGYEGTLKTVVADQDALSTYVINGKLAPSRNSDWALVRRDGCLTLDARLLVEVDGTPPSGWSGPAPTVRFAVSLTGIGKLTDIYKTNKTKTPPIGEQAFGTWTNGDPPDNGNKMNVGSSLRFEVSGPPDPGAAFRYLGAASDYATYLGLSQGTFMGMGTITFKTNKKDKDPEIDYLESMSMKILQLLT